MKGDAYAGGGVELDSLNADRGRQHRQYAFGHPQAVLTAGYRLQYHDEWIRTFDGWRISSRRAYYTFVDGEVHLPAEEAWLPRVTSGGQS